MYVKMKIVIFMIAEALFLKQAQSIQETPFVRELFSSSSELLGNVFVAREVASLRGSTKIRCGSKCSLLEGCWAFVRKDQRCILIGEASLPGNDVTEGDLESDGWIQAYGNTHTCS